MKQTGAISAVILLTFWSSCGSSGSERRFVQETLEAIDSCYHWAGEVGDQTVERNKQIEEGIARDCPAAKSKAEAALKSYPQNADLAAGILQLIDIGQFDTTDVRRTFICNAAQPHFRQDFTTSKHEDFLFRAECAEQATRIYGP